MSRKGESGPDLLSTMLQTYIEDLDRNADELTQADEQELGADERKRFKKLLTVTTRSLEGFAEGWQEKLIKVFQDIPETWEWMVDEYYCREAVDKVRGMVARFLKLSPVLAGVVPSQEVGLYLREATRCYLYGFFEASIALSRAALEAGLNEYLRRRLGSAPSQKLMEKVRAVNKWKLLTTQSAGMAEDVAKAAGMVLHQQPARSQQLSFDTLVRTRGVLRELFQC